MGEVRISLTVFFQEPFWVGVFEKQENSRLSVARAIFGAEPKDHEVYEYLLKNQVRLKFSPAVAAVVTEKKISPKKLQRNIKKSLEQIGVGTKAQQALKLQQEQNKQECKTKSHAKKQAEAERTFALKQQKKKEKHRGR